MTSPFTGPHDQMCWIEPDAQGRVLKHQERRFKGALPDWQEPSLAGICRIQPAAQDRVDRMEAQDWCLRFSRAVAVRVEELKRDIERALFPSPNPPNPRMTGVYGSGSQLSAKSQA